MMELVAYVLFSVGEIRFVLAEHLTPAQCQEDLARVHADSGWRFACEEET